MRALVALATLLLATSAQAAPPPGQPWRLVFHDGFNKLRPDVWNVRGDTPRAAGWWLKDNVKIAPGGFLVIQPTLYQGKMATGAIDTRDKQAWRFGYFEIRAKLPRNPPGHRPAFWLQSQGTFGTDASAQGRKGTEIDIFEAWARDGSVQHNLHWNVERNGPGRTNAGAKAAVPIDYDSWHTFGLWWSPDFYRFYIDGRLSWETSEGGVSQVPEYVLITDEASENDKLGLLHAQQAKDADPFLVDYLRIYQLAPGRPQPPR